MKSIEFIKMEGTGNDYVYADALDSELSIELSSAEIQRISARRTGIGSDGFVIMAPSINADAKMLMWNADGSSSGMCGNALRCVALWIHKKSGKNSITIESASGLHRAEILDPTAGGRAGAESVVRVEIGSPVFAPEKIPCDLEKFRGLIKDKSWNYSGGPVISDITLGDSTYPSVLVSMGNPHCVIFVPDAGSFPVEQYGPYLENHPAFPQRTNIEYVSPDGTGFFQRTHERGSGETLSCGSGACAVLAASVVSGRGPSKNRIRLQGGSLEADWQGSLENPGSIWITGPSRIVFSGRIELQ